LRVGASEIFKEIIGAVFARSQGVERAAKTRRMGLALFSPLQTLCAGRVKHIESTIGLANIFLLKYIVNIYTYIYI
jgi:hypothetical protein